MATTPTPISDLPATTALADNDLVIVQKANGNTSKMTGAKLKEIVTPAASTWGGVTNKPFDAVGSGLYISTDGAQKKLNASSPAWSSVTGRPFSTVGDGLTVENGQLKAAPTWGSVGGKPFSSVEQGLGLSVVDGVLKSTVPTFEPYYAAYGETSYSNILSAFTTGKPVYLLDNNDGTLFATYKVYGNQISFYAPVRSGGIDYLSIRSVNVSNQWSTRNVPLTGGGGGEGESSVVMYRYGDTITPTELITATELGKAIILLDDADLENGLTMYFFSGIYGESGDAYAFFASANMFNTLSGKFTVAQYDLIGKSWLKSEREVLSMPTLPPGNGAVPTYNSTLDIIQWQVPSVGSAAWSAVTGKPFNSIGSGLTVSGGVLSATGGGGGGGVTPDLVLLADGLGHDGAESESEDFTYTKESGSAAAVYDKIVAGEKPVIIVRVISHIESGFNRSVVEASASVYTSTTAAGREISITWLRTMTFSDVQPKFFTKVLSYDY